MIYCMSCFWKFGVSFYGVHTPKVILYLFLRFFFFLELFEKNHAQIFICIFNWIVSYQIIWELFIGFTFIKHLGFFIDFVRLSFPSSFLILTSLLDWDQTDSWGCWKLSEAIGLFVNIELFSSSILPFYSWGSWSLNYGVFNFLYLSTFTKF